MTIFQREAQKTWGVEKAESSKEGDRRGWEPFAYCWKEVKDRGEDGEAKQADQGILESKRRQETSTARERGYHQEDKRHANKAEKRDQSHKHLKKVDGMYI